ncbi:hypothetical protein ACHQM5_026670 [Ranunculus cassubicifolius]
MDGIPSVTFDHHDLAKAAGAFRLALVMKFAHAQRPSIDDIRSEICSKWGLKAGVFCSLLDARHILIRFSQDEDLVRALSRESTRIKGSFYKIFRWTPDFNPAHDASIASVWVQLKE